MLHAGLDLSRKRLDVRVLDDAGATTLETWTAPDRDGLQTRWCKVSGGSENRWRR